MIHYALRCEPGGHGFDGWFRSGAEFDRQAERGLLECPSCGSPRVAKALMRPAVASGREASAVVSPPPADLAALHSRMQEMARRVRAEADYVGPSFAEEARRIHYGDSAERRIYGEATPPEVKGLLEEGIGALPLPPLPEDQN